MKNLFLTLLMIAGLSLSGQDLIVTCENKLVEMVYTEYYPQGTIDYEPTLFWGFGSGIKASWRGITAGVNYGGPLGSFYWEAGYTLTITPQACLRTYGEGIKLGLTYGTVFPESTLESSGIFRDQFTISLGYQKNRWYAEVFRREDIVQYHYGIGIGYAFL